MKRLTLLRHAQAEDKLLGQRDWDRTLTKRGQMDAAEMAKRLKTKRLKPDLILISPALRTLQTGEYFLNGWPDIQHRTQEELYLANTQQLIAVLQDQAEQIQHVLVIGHNPGLTELADLLSSDYRIEGMPTASMVTMKLNINTWQELIPNVASNVEFDYPQK